MRRVELVTLASRCVVLMCLSGKVECKASPKVGARPARRAGRSLRAFGVFLLPLASTSPLDVPPSILARPPGVRASTNLRVSAQACGWRRWATRMELPHALVEGAQGAPPSSSLNRTSPPSPLWHPRAPSIPSLACPSSSRPVSSTSRTRTTSRMRRPRNRRVCATIEEAELKTSKDAVAVLQLLTSWTRGCVRRPPRVRGKPPGGSFAESLGEDAHSQQY